MSDRLPELWVCHPCRMIGPLDAMLGHRAAAGHICERLPAERAESVREIWREQGRSLIDGAELQVMERRG